MLQQEMDAYVDLKFSPEQISMEIINPPFSLKRKELPVTKTCPSKRFKSLESEQSKYQDGIEEDSSPGSQVSKAPQKAPEKSFWPSKHSPNKLGIFCMYAYKDELKNGFASNKNLCLWRRDGARLIRKYFRVKNSDDIFYISNIYRPWPDHEDNYLELNVVCSEIGDKMGHVVKLCDLDQVEAIIVEGNYAALNLAPYVFYRRKVEGESFNERADSQDITQSSKKLVEATVTHQDNSAKQDDEMEVEEIQDEDELKY